ncbi:MAG: hypothetical protein H0T64_10550 [Pyrinomonadaceae bacterium]|nr:hypothetical protein [Pyrinomonadaceae bacterium]
MLYLEGKLGSWGRIDDARLRAGFGCDGGHPISVEATFEQDRCRRRIGAQVGSRHLPARDAARIQHRTEHNQGKAHGHDHQHNPRPDCSQIAK